jgi:solute carrier family 35 protein
MNESTKRSKKIEDKPVKKAPASPSKMVMAALLYGLTSILLVVSNKICLTTFEFPDAVFLALSQCCCTLTVIFVCNIIGVVKLNLSQDAFSRMVLLSIVNAINVGTGLIGTKSVSIPMFTALRRTSIFLTMVGEGILMKKIIKNETKFYVALMCGGAFLGAIYDLSFNFYGYVSILISAFCTALSAILTKINLDDDKLSKWDILVYNNCVALPLYVLGLYVRNSLPKLLTFKSWDSAGFLLYFSVSSMLGITLQFTILYAVQVNGPLALTITGLLKNIITSYLGFLGIGGDYIFTLPNFLGVNVSMVGGILFSRAKYLNAIKQNQNVPEKEDMNSTVKITPKSARMV